MRGVGGVGDDLDWSVDSRTDLGVNAYSSPVPHLGLGPVGRGGFPYEIHYGAQR